MKKIILFFLFIGSLYATSSYETNKTCKGCHPTIYGEFYESAHRKSSMFEDEAHKAIWDKHPLSKAQKYKCAKCHTPTDTKILEALANNQKATPIKDEVQTQEAISCVYCHSIDTNKHGKRSNTNVLVDNNNKKRPMLFAANKDNRNGKILFKEESSFFGMIKKTSGSPYHDIDYTNKNYYNGKMCMGCHAHFENKHAQTICTTPEMGANSEENNCITCHMPQVKGSATTIKITKKHTFHGFAGSRNHVKLLEKYVVLTFKKTDNGFEIIIQNKAPHKLFIQTLRLAQLNVRINSNNTTVSLEPKTFARILGKDGKDSMPWVANEVLKDNMIKANETRVVKYNTAVKAGDIVEVEFGYYLVDPAIHKALDLTTANSEATKFHLLKTEFFTVK